MASHALLDNFHNRRNSIPSFQTPAELFYDNQLIFSYGLLESVGYLVNIALLCWSQVRVICILWVRRP